MPKRRNHDVGFKARVALEAVKDMQPLCSPHAPQSAQPTF